MYPVSRIIEKVLGPNGLIAQSFPGFEPRPQQLQMAQAIASYLDSARHLAVEAGTGIGKSFAYLAGAIDQVHRKKARVLVSTFTITLQEQLTGRDIPFLADIFPQQFTAQLAKGRANYICLRRLEFALRRQQSLFIDAAALAAIKDWAGVTEDGSLSDLSLSPPARLWDAVKSEHGNCRGRKCPHFRKCFYFKARRKLQTADIIVANHALLFSDLALKGEEAPGVLPDYRYVIIDEAQNIEHVAEEHFGINITEYRINHLLNTLYNPRTRRGILAFTKENEAINLVAECSKAAKLFFKKVRSWYEQNADDTNGRCHANFVDDNLTEPIKKLRLALAHLAKKNHDQDEKTELAVHIDRCRALEQDLANFLTQPDSDSVYWIELDSGGPRRGRPARVSLRSAPLNIGPYIKKCLFDEFESVILTSATLSCNGPAPAHPGSPGWEPGEKAGFEFFASRIGLEDYEALKLGSPFDYEKQVTMYIEAGLANPNDEVFEPAAAEAIKKYIRLTHGKAFVLFTSYKMLSKMASELSGWLDENNITLLQQQAHLGGDRTTLLAHFRKDTNSVLFGTDSFWQGVDVPGEALSNVIIVRLPFAVPNHPLIAGRIEQLRLEGQNPFYKYQLPQAIIKFKQGFGRLVRNKTDKGIIVVLDSRIIRKSYGKQFLAAIPKCNIQIISTKKPVSRCRILNTRCSKNENQESSVENRECG